MDEHSHIRTLEEALLRSGLEKGDLDIECPDEVRNMIALELEDWQICQTLAREGFNFPDSRIAAIARLTKQEDKRKIDLLCACMSQCKNSAKYLKLAQALYSANLDCLVDKLCEAREKYPKTRIADGDAAHLQGSDNGREGSMDSAYGSSIQPQITSTPVQNEVPTIYSVSSDSKLPGSESIICFSETMSEEHFFCFLKNEGFSVQDCDILKKNGFGAKMFANGFNEKDIENSQLGFTYGGKQVLRRLLKELCHGTQIGDLTIIRDEIIGNGSFGSVFKGTWKQNPCAAKVLHSLGQEMVTGLRATKGQGQKEALARFKKECEFMKKLQHPNIVCYYDTLLHPMCNLPILVMELMHISLCNYISQQPHLSMSIQFSISCDVSAALKFLHDEDIVHRDLCGDNILLNSSDDIPVAKVSDFGMSRVIVKCGSLTHSLTAMGRRGFLPPEPPALYDSSLDIFMFGVVMVMIANKVSNVEHKKQRERLIQEIKDEHPLKTVICQCLSEKKENRPNTAAVHTNLLKIKNESTAASMETGTSNVGIHQDPDESKACAALMATETSDVDSHQELKSKDTTYYVSPLQEAANIQSAISSAEANQPAPLPTETKATSLEVYVGKRRLTMLIGKTVLKSGDFSEVDVSKFEKEGSVIGLFFSAHWCPPSRTFTPMLADWYNKFKKGPNGDLFDIIFVSSDSNEGEWMDYFLQMPWYSLPYDPEKKSVLSSKFNVEGIPTLIFVDGVTGKLITKDGRDIVSSDPDGDKFPWIPKPLSEILANAKLADSDNKEVPWEQLHGKVVGFFFSAHWSRSRSIRVFTPQLVTTYNKLKEAGKNFEIIFISCDTDEESWQEYRSSMPWIAVPFKDKCIVSLTTTLDIQYVPSLIIVDEKGDIITTRGCNAVRSDLGGAGFPWYVNMLTEETVEDIADVAALIWFVPNQEKDKTRNMLEPVAKAYISKCAEQKLDIELMFFISCKGCDGGSIRDRIQSIAGLPTCEHVLAIVDIPQRKAYISHESEIASDNARKFVCDYFAKKLTGKKLVPRTAPQDLQLYVESEVLQSCFADHSFANLKIDAELFGTLLVQYEIATETTVSGPIYAPGVQTDQRISALFQIADMRIREEPSPQSARNLFNKVVMIIADPLGCMELAQTLVTMCKLKDTTYVSPLQSRADTHPSQDACPMNSSSDSMCGNKRPGKIPTMSELQLLKYTVEGKEKIIRIIDCACCKWKEIATFIFDDVSKVRVIEHDHKDAKQCLRQTFIEGFIDNKPKNYSRDWQGLIILLKDVELEVLAEEVQSAIILLS